MAKDKKILLSILSGTSDKNIAFNDLVMLLKKFGFAERVNGSHRIFFKKGVEEIINLQPRGSEAKPYQVKQVRHIILKYHLGGLE